MTEQETSSPTRGRRSSTLILVGAVALALLVVVLTFRPHPEPSSETADGAEKLAPATRAAVYLPAEFTPQDYLLLGGTQLVNLFPGVLAAVAQAVADSVNLRILAGNPADHARIDSILTATDSPAVIDDLRVRSMWVRDFGPLTVNDARGGRHLIDFEYRERRGNIIDNGVPAQVGAALGLPVEDGALLVEGGDLLTNGRGFCLLSTRLINRNAHYRDLEPQETVNRLAARLGFEQVSLAHPLHGESTGHVDMFATFVAVDLVVIGQYAAAEDSANAALLDGLAQDLATQQTLVGPLRVERIPMPNHDDGVWRTYTNVVFANGVVLVPVYPDYCPDLDQVALATYRRLLPDRQVVGVDASRLIRMNGALRCITLNIPRGLSLATGR